MEIYYRVDSDYLEVFFENKIENYADFEESGLTVFRAEKDDRIVGYGLEGSSEKINLILERINGLGRLAILLRIARTKVGMTQKEAASLIGIDLRQYQRIESGENTKLDVVLKAKEVFPNAPLEAVLMGQDLGHLSVA